MKNRVLSAAFALSLLAPVTHASVIVTLTHDGLDGVNASVSGSGSIGPSFPRPEGPTLEADDLGDYVTNVEFTFFPLASPVSFSTGVDIIGLFIDDDGVADQGGLLLSTAIGAATSYNVSGSSFVNGLSFATLTVGTFTNQSGAFEFPEGELTYIIQDVQVTEPATLVLLGLGATGIGFGRRKFSKAD